MVVQGISKDQGVEETTLEEEIEHIPRVPPTIGRQMGEGSSMGFCIGSYDPRTDPNSQGCDQVLDAEEDEEFIQRGIYHAERTLAYFKVCNTLPNLHNCQ